MPQFLFRNRIAASGKNRDRRPAWRRSLDGGPLFCDDAAIISLERVRRTVVETDFQSLFSDEVLASLFPEQRADAFFEALFGDAGEGAYDIRLRFREDRGDALFFEMALSARPGRCLACNLTWGLPEVFSRHPVIDIEGLVERIGEVLNGASRPVSWELGQTRQVSRDLHVIPLTIRLKPRSSP
jgi:hypothetical protein